MPHLNSLFLFNSIVLAGVGVLGFATVSCSNQMQGTTYTSNNPVPTPFGARSLASELMPCNDTFRPLRVAFVIDNTGSNNAKPGVVQRGPNYVGSDSIKSFDDDKYLLKEPDMSQINTENIYTYRQYAVYKSILKLQKAGLASRKNNPQYQGIDVNVSHFPKNVDLQEEAEFHFGQETGLPSKMTDVSKIESSAEFSQKIWSMLKFTHDSKGMTPYVTAFSAAQTVLVSEKKPDDNRQGLMILVTDGLPTDRTPSAIKAARKQLGAQTRVALLSIYPTDDANDENQNALAKKDLSTMFTDGWGQEEHPTFESYWKALLAIPQSNEVRDDYIQVNSNQLNKSIDGVLDRYLKCKR